MYILFPTIYHTDRGVFMQCNMESLCRKEVINVCNGDRIGYVRDVNIDTQTARICSLIVESDAVFSLKKKDRCMVVDWNCIQVIGAQTILVRCENIPLPCEQQKTKKISALFSR